MTDLNERASASGGKLVHALEGETMVIEPWGRDGLRVRATRGPEVLDTAWALTEPVNAGATILISESEAVIRNGRISARIHDLRTQRGRLQFFRHPSPSSEVGTRILSEQDYIVGAHNPGTRIFRPSGDGLFHTELHLAPREGERLYGMGLNDTGTVST